MSSTGGGLPAGLLVDATLADLDLAWKEREQEAQLLGTHGHESIALSLRLYSLEIRLKCTICRHLNLPFLPRACKTHDLSELIIFSGLWGELNDPANAGIRQSWDLIVDFSKRRLNDLRYHPESNLTAAEKAVIAGALDDSNNGVLAWLSKHP